MEFADHRPYRPGDDLRLVDWNVYRRLRTVLVRLFHEDRNVHAGVVLDASASMGTGTPPKADHGATLAAALALVGLTRRDTVTLSLAGGTARRSRLRGHQLASFAAVLSTLEAAEPDGVPDLAQAIHRLTDRGRLDRAVLISDLLVEPEVRLAALRALASAARRPVLLHVLAADELEPDLSRGLEAVDAETGETVHVGAGAVSARAYADALAAYLRSVRERCAGLRIGYVLAPTSVPVRTLVLDALRQARVVESARGAGR